MIWKPWKHPADPSRHEPMQRFKSGGILDFVLPTAAAIATPFIGPELIPASLAGTTGVETAADALVGAGLGAASQAATGGNPLTGALTGGVAGGIAPNISDIASGVSNAFGGGGTAAGGAATGTTGAATDIGTAIPTPSIAGIPQNIASTSAGVGTSGGQSALGSTLGADVGAVTPNISSDITSAAPQNLATSIGTGVTPSAATGNDLVSRLLATPSNAGNIPITPTDTSLGGKVSDLLKGSSVGDIAKVAIPALGLGYEALKGTPKIPELPQLTTQAVGLGNQANQLETQGAALTAPLTTGVLPAGAQSAIDQASEAAKASIRSQYASMGLSGSTMEQQALNSVDEQATAQGFQIAQQMAQQGLSMTQAGLGATSLSANIYNSLMQAQLQQDKQLQDAITGFATAAAGSGSTIKIG